jgi:hypothetical protein
MLDSDNMYVTVNKYYADVDGKSRSTNLYLLYMYTAYKM